MASSAPGSSRDLDGAEVEDWEPDVGAEFSLFYDSLSVEEQGDSDSKVSAVGIRKLEKHPFLAAY